LVFEECPHEVTILRHVSRQRLEQLPDGPTIVNFRRQQQDTRWQAGSEA